MVREQFENVRKGVRELKDHPALLVWGVGNEVEIDGEDPLVWKAIEDVCKMIKQEDPNHPTMVVVAEVNQDKINSIKKYVPSVDILGVNSYAGLASLPRRLTEFGWTKPYVVPEFGPRGPWEVRKTDWGAPIEQTSTEKAALYAAMMKLMEEDPRCLGSYAFLFGWKQEQTPTWFGMYLETGERLAAMDEISRSWRGQFPANRAPAIEPLVIGRDKLTAGAVTTVSVKASDPNGDALTFSWKVMHEPEVLGKGGDKEPVPPKVEGLVVPAGSTSPTLTAPDRPGAYRLYVTVRDGKGGAATANIPFLVQ
jgi:hypothetical protein